MNKNQFSVTTFRWSKYMALNMLAMIALLLATLPLTPASAATDTYNTAGTFTWIAPAGVSSVTVEVWGGGGEGGTRTFNGGSGGGGGGAYSRKASIPVTPGNSYSVVVGAGATTTASGGDSYFINNGTVLAKGGGSVTNDNSNGAQGGQASAGVGDTKYSGGNGASAGSGRGGGGGSSAGTAANGNNGSGSSGGTAPTGGGAGGGGRLSTTGNGSDGSLPGGAGGGAYKSSSGTASGGRGQDGQVRITYTPITYSLSVIKNGTGTGMVTSNPSGINCDPTCSASFSYNTSVILTAIPNAGSTFTGWSSSGCSGTGTCSVTMTIDTSVTATFTPITYTISGNSGAAGATLSYMDGTPKTATADGSGNYTLTVSYNWSGTVTPSKTGYIFTPTSRIYTNVTANKTGENYAAILTYAISGNAGVASATLSYTDGTLKTATTNSSGNYTLIVSSNWSGTVTPSLTGYIFTPTSKTYSNVTANKTGENYTAAGITYTISGNAGVAGATLSYTDGTLKTVTADSSGNYTLPVSYNWSGTVIPSKTGYAFVPGSKAYVNVLADKTFQNYTAVQSNVIYYVNNTISCSDSNTGFTPAQPFCTIGKGADVASAGNTVRVMAGTYAEKVVPPYPGSIGNPITFSAAPGVTVTGDGSPSGSAFRLSNTSYITIDGFTITGTKDYGIYVYTSNHITISNNHVTLSGSPVLDSERAGIYFYSTSDSTISGNITDHNSSHGIQLSNLCSNVTVSNNVSFANATVYMRDATGISVFSNSFNNTIIHNITYANEDTGLNFYTGAHDNRIIGNVSYGNGDHGIDDNNAPNNIIVGNTIQGNVTVGINLEGDTGSAGATVENNISVDNRIFPQTGEPGNIRVDAQSIAGTVLDYNIVYHHVSFGGSTVQIVWGAVYYNFLSDFQSATGQENHGLQIDPLLVSPAPPASRPPTVVVGDYHLSAGSPAIDSANSDAPSEPTLDIEGNSRVDDPLTLNVGTGTRAYDDRGAYEFQPPVCYTLTLTTGVHGSTPAASPTKSAACATAGQYVQSELITLTAIPDPYYSVASWSGTNNDSSTSTTNTVTMPANAHTVGVIYSQIVYTLTVTSDHGTVNRDNPGPYHHGDVVQLTAVPNAGWSFANWTGDVSASTNPVSITIDGNKSVTANYTQNIYTLTVTSDHGVVNRDNPGPYHYGDKVQLTAVPDAGWSFANWSVNASGSANPVTITMDDNKAVTANYTQNEYTLMVTTDHGTVNRDNPGPYHYGDKVQLTSVPDTGWSFANWTGNASGSTNPVTITMDGNKSVTANYTQNEYTLTITSDHGTVNRDNPGPYHYGDVIQLTAVPDVGWSFVNWTGDSSGSTNPISITINGNKAVTANYTQNIVISGNAGVGSAILSYNDGGSKTVTADLSGNYAITVPYNWSGTITPSKASYTFSPPSRTYTNVVANQTGQNFTAKTTYKTYLPLVTHN
jgi:parallel beta-helix repeat protein